MIDHVGFEVSDLERSGRFYDAVFGALGGRRLLDSAQAVAYGINAPTVWIVMRGREPAAGYGHIALTASGKAAVDAAHEAGLAHGGQDDGAPGRNTAPGTTPPTCGTPMGSGSKWFPGDNG